MAAVKLHWPLGKTLTGARIATVARNTGGGVRTKAPTSRLTLQQAAVLPAADVLSALGVSGLGLDEGRVADRLAADGPNVLPGHRATGWSVLMRQFANPVLLLLLIAACLAFATGDQVNALIIGAIMTASTGLGFVNEYRAERTAQDLHRQVSHSVVVVRGGRDRSVDVKDLVVGDLVRVGLGSIVPADVRVVECDDLEADESVLTGEAVPVVNRRRRWSRGPIWPT